MNCSLICMDIDGTLLDDRQRIPERTKAALKRAADSGIKLALVSMRYPPGIDEVEQRLGLPCIKAAYAGAYIYDENGEIFSKQLSAEDTFSIYRIVSGLDVSC